MRRLELALAVAVLAILGGLALALGGRRHKPVDADPRRSSFVASPAGARGLADALTLLRVDVRRLRRRPDSVDAIAPNDTTTVLAVLSPDGPLSRADAGTLAARVRHGGDILVAGGNGAEVFRCYGLRYAALADSVKLHVGANSPLPAPSAWAELRAAGDSEGQSDSIHSAEVPACLTPVTRLDTLAEAGSHAVAVRARVGSGGSATLVADGSLFANRRLRESSAGEFALGLLVPRYRRVVFDEYHHGFGPSGSLLQAVLEWSRRSPWGWAGWQLAVVGLIALAAGAVRFVPPRRFIERRRRSPLEHVRALASALAAARGHDVAIATQVRGLRRRLERGTGASGRPVGPWLEQLAENVRTPRARAAVQELRSFTRGPQPAESVLRAAQAVEDVWTDLKP